MSDILENALKHLPHGPEFRFVDRILSLEPGKSGVAEYLVRGDEPFLHGHFPGAPIMPGVLLVEAVAQLAGAVAQSDPQITKLRGLKLCAITAAKIRGTAVPGEKIIITAEICGRLGLLIQARGSVAVRNHSILTTSVSLAGEEG